MKLNYFQDTDTLLIEFSNNAEETSNLNENMMVEFDSEGKLASITIEHVKELIA